MHLETPPLTELLVRAKQSALQIKVLISGLVEQFATGPNVGRVVEVKDEREALLVVELSIERASNVKDFGFHRGKRLQEEVWVATDQVADVRVVAAGRVTTDHAELAQEQGRGVTVLQGELWVRVQDANDLRGFDFVGELHVVKKTSEVGDFASQQAARVSAHVDDLVLCEAILAELSHKEAHFVRVAAE